MSDFRLKVFLSVAKNLSFTKASQELFISQPAISKHIQELENRYQTCLFDRHGSNISLTEQGKLLVEHSERILEAYRRLEYDMNLFKGEHSGNLKLGASTTIEQYVIPLVLGNYIRRFPQVNVSIVNGNSRFIENSIQNHDIDLGMVEGIIRLPQLKYTTFMEDELVAVVHPHNRLSALPDEITLEKLAEIPLVLREQGSGTLDVIERSLLEHNIKLSQLNIRMYLGSTECIKRFCETNECMGIVSIRSISKELMEDRLKIIEIPEMPMKRTFSFVQCQGQDNSLKETFIDYMLSKAKELL